MGRQKLNPKIFSKLKKKFPKKSDNAIRVKLSKLSKKYRITLNAASEIWGREEKFSTWGLLDDKDRKSLENKKIEFIKVKGKKKGKRSIINFVVYPTSNKFLKAHLDEINKCYTHGCYTASFILIRKVIENLIVKIIKKKFPGKSRREKELYLNLNEGRILDLSKVITNLRKKCSSFEPEEKKLILRILQLSEEFKDDANDKTHSLYHISNKSELDRKDSQNILDLIEEFFGKH